MAKRLSTNSIASKTSMRSNQQIQAKKHFSVKASGSQKTEDAGRAAQDKKIQELIKRRNEIMAHRKREEEWFKVQFQLMTNAWDNLEAEDDTIQTDTNKPDEGEIEELNDEPDFVREISAEIVTYRILPDERRVYVCGGLRQVKN